MSILKLPMLRQWREKERAGQHLNGLHPNAKGSADTVIPLALTGKNEVI